MATADFKVCGICEMRHKTNQATMWCPECEDPLCADCEEHHSISKGTRNHTTVPIGDYQKLPAFILDAKMFCAEHNEKYHHYCMSHERPLCKICVVTAHKACKDLKTIEDVTGNCKSSYAMEAVEKDLKEIACNIEHVKQDRESNLSAIKKQRNSIIKKVSELRAKINQHLDRIEKVFLSDLSSVADENEKRIADLLDSLNSKESKIMELQKSIRGMKEHASDFQTFIGMKEIEKRIYEEKSYIRSIFEGASLNQIEISCSFDSLMENCTTSTKKMGILSVKENPPQIDLEIESEKQAQTKSPVYNSDNELRLKLEHQMNLENDKNKQITCCCTLSTGVHVFAFYPVLAIYRSDLSFMHNISLNGRYPTDVTQTSSTDVVAVATGLRKEVLIIEVHKKNILKTIKIEDSLWGIDFRDGHLIYCAQSIGLKLADIHNFQPSPLYQTDVNLPAFVKAFKDKICITDTRDSNVKILGPDMKEIFHSKNRPGLNKPSYITADEFGYIYIANKESPCCVTVVSPDCQRCQSFELNELQSLYGLSYDSTTKRLVVASSGCKVSFYSIRQ